MGIVFLAKETMRTCEKWLPIKIYYPPQKKVKNLIQSQFFYCSHKIKEPQGNSQGSKFWSSITDKIAQYLLSVGGGFVSFQPQKKT